MSAPPGTRTGTISETVAQPATMTADREGGVIRGVKVAGLTSKNNRRYERSGVEAALKHYEGAPCFIDHPTDQNGRVDPKRDRSSEHKFGHIQNVRLEGDGLYGDLRFLKSHPMAERVCEAAESMHNAFGLSHNVDFHGHTDKDGTLIVESIDRVRSIDLVASPATTNSLFESEQEGGGVKIAVRRHFQAALKKLAAGNRRTAVSGWLAEQEGDPLMDAPMDLPPAEPDPMEVEEKSPEEHLADGFEAALMACIGDDSLTADEKIAKVKELLKAQEKLTGPDSSSAPEPPSEPSESSESGDDESGEKTESLIESCERLNIPVTSRLVKSFRDVPKSAVEGILCEMAEYRTRPRSGGRGSELWQAHGERLKANSGGSATESIEQRDERLKAEADAMRRRRTTPHIEEAAK